MEEAAGVGQGCVVAAVRHKAQTQLGDGKRLIQAGIEPVRAERHVKAAHERLISHRINEYGAEAKSVLKPVYALAELRQCTSQEHATLAGGAAQKSARYVTAGRIFFSSRQFPARHRGGALCGSGFVSLCNVGSRDCWRCVRGGTEQGIGPGIALAVAESQKLELKSPVPERGCVAICSQVEVIPARAEAFRVHDVWCGAVRIAQAQRGNIDAVQRIGIAGAEDVLHLQAPGLRRLTYAPHECGLPAAGSALDDPQEVPVAPAEALVKRAETVPGVCAQKPARDLLLFHISIPLKSHFPYTLCRSQRD